MTKKRALEHYKKHEIVAEATAGLKNWKYNLTVLSHDGDISTAVANESRDGFASDLAALHAAKQHGRKLVDERVASEA